jgi:MoaA/NifB/PqqE/SkfB family radical SAM enzyme
MAALVKYLEDSARFVLRYALKTALKNPKELLFIARYAVIQRRAAQIRRAYEKRGAHIPLFLIASIAARCNLRCAGCYHHALREDAEAGMPELDAGEWARLFREAQSLGIPFILLAGGEPLLRPDVLRAAAKERGILFPVFTNGTLLKDGILRLFEKHRALIPVLSLEGGKTHTDARRGSGVFEQIDAVLTALFSRRLPFGISITVKSENLLQVTKAAFIEEAKKRGCAFIVYVEYLPADGKPDGALCGGEREELAARIARARRDTPLLIISFPADEEESGGCLAAGRGFFHINPWGGAEPCPFSPYSDTQLRDGTLLDALKSPLFQALNAAGLLRAAHHGPCRLLEAEAEVARLAVSSL